MICSSTLPTHDVNEIGLRFSKAIGFPGFGRLHAEHAATNAKRRAGVKDEQECKDEQERGGSLQIDTSPKKSVSVFN